MKSIKSQDYYEMLGISRRASQEDIRRAFDLCKHTFQDDSLATYSLYSAEENKEIFSQMSQAYEVLYDPGSRREYDSYLSQKEGRSSGQNEGERMVASMIGVAKDPTRENASASKKRARAEFTPPVRKKKTKSAKAAPEQETVSADKRAEQFLESVDAITGPVLKKIRTIRGISLDDISDQTKIRKTYIRYLEDEEFDFLPAPVYIKGFVSNIASILGLPVQRAANDYMVQYRLRQDGD